MVVDSWYKVSSEIKPEKGRCYYVCYETGSYDFLEWNGEKWYNHELDCEPLAPVTAWMQISEVQNPSKTIRK